MRLGGCGMVGVAKRAVWGDGSSVTHSPSGYYVGSIGRFIVRRVVYT